MDLSPEINTARRRSRTRNKFYHPQRRVNIAKQFSRSDNQTVYQDYTNRMLRQFTHRQTLADKVAKQREKHRERLALRRRGFHHPTPEPEKSYSVNNYRSLHHLSVRERQAYQLSREMAKRIDRRNKIAEHNLKTTQAYALLQDLAVLINSVLQRLLDPAVQSSRFEFEALADYLVKYIELALPQIKLLGPGQLQVGWCWEDIERFYAFLYIEESWGRIPGEWSKYRMVLDKLAPLVATSTYNPHDLFVFSGTDYSPMEDVRVEDAFTFTRRRRSSNTVMRSPPVNFSPPTIAPSAESRRNAETEMPKMTEIITALNMLPQLPAVGNPAAPSTPVTSLPKTPEAVAASSIPRRSSELSAPLEQAAPPPASRSIAAVSDTRSHILNGTGRFAVNSMSSIDDLLFVLNHSRYSVIFAVKAKALHKKMLSGATIHNEDIEFMLRSCQYVLANANATWFDRKRIVAEAQEWWGNEDAALWRLKAQLEYEGSDDRPRLIKKLDAYIKRVLSVLGVSPLQKVAHTRRRASY